MKKITLIILILVLLPYNLFSKLIIIQTEDILGKCVIEKDDTVIIQYGSRLEYELSQIPIHLVLCGSDRCVKDKLMELKYTYRTNGISIQYVK